MAKKDAKNDNEEESEYSGDDFDISKSSLKPNNQKKAIHVKEEAKNTQDLKKPDPEVKPTDMKKIPEMGNKEVKVESQETKIKWEKREEKSDKSKMDEDEDLDSLESESIKIDENKTNEVINKDVEMSPEIILTNNEDNRNSIESSPQVDVNSNQNNGNLFILKYYISFM